MKFQGDIRSIPIADVFQNLAANLKSGLLVIVRGDEKRQILFLAGKVISYTDNQGFSLLGRFQKMGLVDREVLAQAFQEFDQSGTKNLADFLEEKGLIKKEDYRTQTRAMVKEALYEILSWKEGSFEFKENPTVVPGGLEVTGSRLEILVGPLLIEAARRIDDWETIHRYLPSENDFYRVMPEDREKLERELEGDDIALDVLKRLNGSHSIGEVISDSMAALRISRFEVCRSIAHLIAGQWGRQVDGAELLAEVDSASIPQEKARALVRLKAVFEREPGNRALLEKAADLSLEVGKKEESSTYRKLLARALLDDEHFAGAERTLRQALELDPRNVGAWQLLFETMERKGDAGALLTVGLEVAGSIRRLGFEEIARDILARLANHYPESVEVRFGLADSLNALGDRTTAVERLLDLAKTLLEKGRIPAAERTLIKVMRYDQDHQRAREIYERIFRHQARPRSPRRSRKQSLVIGGAAALLAIVVLVFLGNDLIARRAFAQATREVLDAGLRDPEDYREAYRRLEAVRDRYPLSLMRLFEGKEILEALRSRAEGKQ